MNHGTCVPPHKSDVSLKPSHPSPFHLSNYVTAKTVAAPVIEKAEALASPFQGQPRLTKQSHSSGVCVCVLVKRLIKWLSIEPS